MNYETASSSLQTSAADGIMFWTQMQ